MIFLFLVHSKIEIEIELVVMDIIVSRLAGGSGIAITQRLTVSSIQSFVNVLDLWFFFVQHIYPRLYLPDVVQAEEVQKFFCVKDGS